MTQREIQDHLEEIYGVEVSPSLISTVTDAVLDEVRAWQSRPLDSVYPILYLDALQVKVKSQGRVTNKAIYLQRCSYGCDLIAAVLEPAADVCSRDEFDGLGQRFLQLFTRARLRRPQGCLDL